MHFNENLILTNNLFLPLTLTTHTKKTELYNNKTISWFSFLSIQLCLSSLFDCIVAVGRNKPFFGEWFI